MDRALHVRTQLALRPDRNATAKGSNDSIWICCPYHGGGNERTQSCRINLQEGQFPVGQFYCFGCQAKGSWNSLASTLNLSGFKARDRVNDVFAFSFAEVEAETDSVKVPVVKDYQQRALWPRHKMWRQIEPRVVRTFGGCAPVERYPGDWLVAKNFIYFPVIVNSAQVGGIYARRRYTRADRESNAPKYLNTANRWTSQFVFGYDIAKRRNRQPLWIVEGPRDAMKVYQMGGRAIALMGAYLTPRKLRLIEALDPPRVVLATDPDEAGDKARAKLLAGLRDFPITEAVFPAGHDPGDFTQRRYDRMTERLGL